MRGASRQDVRNELRLRRARLSRKETSDGASRKGKERTVTASLAATAKPEGVRSGRSPTAPVETCSRPPPLTELGGNASDPSVGCGGR